MCKYILQEKISPVSDKSFLYGVIGGGIGGLTVVAAIVAVLVYFNRARGKAPEVDGIDSLSTMCFEASFKYSDRNSRLRLWGGLDNWLISHNCIVKKDTKDLLYANTYRICLSVKFHFYWTTYDLIPKGVDMRVLIENIYILILFSIR